MVRTAKFDAGAFVEAAIDLIADGGPAAASTTAIARKVGAPTGSLYHRFESRAAVVATAWADVHGPFVARLDPLLRSGRITDAALALSHWVREDITRARFLLLNEGGAIIDEPPPEHLRMEIGRQEDRIDAAFQTCLAVCGVDPQDNEAVARVRFLVFDGPIALVRPHLLAKQRPPPFVDAMITELHAACALPAGTASEPAVA